MSINQGAQGNRFGYKLRACVFTSAADFSYYILAQLVCVHHTSSHLLVQAK